MKTKPVQYTEEYVLDEVKEILAILLLEKDTVFIGELIEERPYSIQRFSEWSKMGGEISETIEKIKNILETRAVVGGLKNKLSANMTKFHLINNFDWKDKTETDHTTKGDKIVFAPPELINKHDLSTPSPEQDSNGLVK